VTGAAGTAPEAREVRRTAGRDACSRTRLVSMCRCRSAFMRWQVASTSGVRPSAVSGLRKAWCAMRSSATRRLAASVATWRGVYLRMLVALTSAPWRRRRSATARASPAAAQCRGVPSTRSSGAAQARNEDEDEDVDGSVAMLASAPLRRSMCATGRDASRSAA
jgi:hypothetical protein